MDEGERELQLLRRRVVDSVNALRNRIAVINSHVNEFDAEAQTPALGAALTGIMHELNLTLALGDELLAAAGYESRDVPRLIRSGDAHPTAAPAHVLVVDDDPSSRSTMARVLTRMGHHVTPVADGLQAFEVLELGGVECIVSDYQMPHLGGGSLFVQVENRLPEYAGRFVFVTGDYSRDETRTFLERTGQPYLGKPYELDELAAAVAGILAKYRR